MGGRGNFSGGTIRTTSNLSKMGTPNSRAIQYKNGKKYKERFYGDDGRAIKDIHYTDHGNPKQHPNVPHTQRWGWKNGKWTLLEEGE